MNMNFTIKIPLTLSLALVFFTQANAQINGKITGKVIDAGNKAAVDYATISIFKQGAASPFNGTSTDEKGSFVLSEVKPGDYKITVDFLGYQKKTFDHVVVGSAGGTVQLGTILLASSQNQLQTVNITAKAPIVENKIDKLVYNAANDLTAQGGVALDVLKKVPMVSVDIDGNVELEGNSNIRFLINGKPSSIFGASLADALQSIPASQIKSIEVITSPGAKYDASGTGGIINIILKDNNVQGVNGSVNLSAGTRLENGSFNLNAKKGNFGVSAFFSGNEQLNSTTFTTTNRTSADSANDITKLNQYGSSSFRRSGYQSGISFDWNISKKDELTASFGFNHFGNHGSGPTSQLEVTTDADGATTGLLSSFRNSTSSFSANSSDVSLGYKKTFNKKDQELDILYTGSFGSNNSDYSQVQNYLLGGYPSSGSIGYNPGTDRETDISVDYTQPFSKKFTLQTGAKLTIEDISNSIVTDTLLENGSYVLNSNQTYGFDYNRDIFAYYASGNFSLFKDFVTGQAGLRYEYTTATSNFPNTSLPDYGILAPSFILQHKLNEKQSFKFAYSYRIQRPAYSDLNPFLNISDPHTISTGDPNLKPELGHNYEFGFNQSFDKGSSIYLSAFYRYNTNDIQSFTTYYSTYNVNGTEYSDVFLTQRSNIGSETNEGVNVYISVPVTGKLSLRSNMFVADRITNNPGSPQVSGATYRVNLNASYDFGNNFVAEVFGNYRSSQRTIQGTNPGFGFYNIAVRKQFLKKTASIGLTAANPFNYYVSQTAITSGTGFTQSSLRQIPLQSFGISINYRFGKLEFKKDKEDTDKDNTPIPAEGN
jgi:ferric enterobactin receptor